mgnify:CR=1 FL=1
MKLLRKNRKILAFLFWIIVCQAVLFLNVSCSKNSYEGMIIAELDKDSDLNSKNGSSLLAFDSENKKAPRILLKKFHNMVLFRRP